MSTESLDAENVAAAVRTVVGVDVVAVDPVAGSVSNQDFRVDLADGRRALVKVGPALEVTAEAWALGAVAAAGVPVPTVLGFLAQPEGIADALVVLEWLPGDGAPSTEALRSVGAALRAAHSIEVAGYGPIEVVGDPLRPESVTGWYDTWADYLGAILADLDRMVEAGLLTRDQSAQIHRRADDLAVSPLAGESGVLLHADVKRDHVLATGGRLNALIDWGDAGVGDPAWDLARASMMGGPAFAAVAEGYRVGDGDAVARLLPIYRVLWNVNALAHEHAVGGDWFAEYQRRIAADLPRL